MDAQRQRPTDRRNSPTTEELRTAFHLTKFPMSWICWHFCLAGVYCRFFPSPFLFLVCFFLLSFHFVSEPKLSLSPSAQEGKLGETPASEASTEREKPGAWGKGDLGSAQRVTIMARLGRSSGIWDLGGRQSQDLGYVPTARRLPIVPSLGIWGPDVLRSNSLAC
jgi:hypothetical protein